jgi:hypothetical protein
MFRGFIYSLAIIALANIAQGEDPSDQGDKLIGGMSVVGNDEAPKSLAIVPWKASDPGDALDVSRDLDDGRQPVDKDVFLRELDYYEIRAGTHETDASDPR